MRVRSLALVFALVSGALGAGSAACSNTSDDSGSSDSAIVSEYYGSWTIEKGGPADLTIPDVPFHTVAGIILRQDGTFYAQLTPRKISAEHFADDSQMIGMPDGLEVVGGWQGLEGRWILSPIKSTGGRTLQLTTRGSRQPTIALDVTIVQGVMHLTDSSYAGRLPGKTDNLRPVRGDCRTTAVVKTRDELDVDAIEQDVFGLGTPLHQPLAYEMDLVGDLPAPDARCTKPVNESSLRTVWKNKTSGAIRAVQHTWSDLTSSDGFTTYAQSYVYDDAGTLRLIVTTIEENALGGLPSAATDGGAAPSTDPDAAAPADPDASTLSTADSDASAADAGAPAHVVIPPGPQTTVRQERTYFGRDGSVLRTFVQPHVEQAFVLPESNTQTGRRFVDLNSPVGVTDLPLCVASAAPVRRIASSPSDAAASLAAAPVCSAQ